MCQPVFSLRLEEDAVQRVGTKLCLEVKVEESQEKVFFEWRGPSGSNADDGRVKITESGRCSTAEITPLHLQVIPPCPPCPSLSPVVFMFTLSFAGPGTVDLLS